MRTFPQTKHRSPETFEGLPLSWALKKLRDSVWYMYNDQRVLYPQLMTAAHKAGSEYVGHDAKTTSENCI